MFRITEKKVFNPQVKMLVVDAPDVAKKALPASLSYRGSTSRASESRSR